MAERTSIDEMSVEYYTPALSRVMRIASDSIQQQYVSNKGTVVLESHLELWMPVARIAPAKRAFMNWYRATYNPPGPDSEILLWLKLTDENQPLYIAGLLSQFANVVDEIVAVANTLSLAASILEKYGWIQGKSASPDRGFCLVGAIDHALRSTYKIQTDADALWGASLSVLRDKLQTSLLVEWNDTPGRTSAEVIHLLKETAAGVRIINP